MWAGRRWEGEEQRSEFEREWSLGSDIMCFCSSLYGDSFLITTVVALWLYFTLFRSLSPQTLRTVLFHRISSILRFGWNPSYFKTVLLSLMAFSPISGLNPDKSLLNDIRHYTNIFFFLQNNKWLFQLLSSVQDRNKSSERDFKWNKLPNIYVLKIKYLEISIIYLYPQMRQCIVLLY